MEFIVLDEAARLAVAARHSLYAAIIPVFVEESGAWVIPARVAEDPDHAAVRNILLGLPRATLQIAQEEAVGT